MSTRSASSRYLDALESIERRAWRDLIAVMPAPLAQQAGLVSAEIHHAHFLMAARIPLFLLNWLAGTGLQGDDGSSIPEAVRRFREAGQRKFIIQIPPGPNAAECRRRATAEGLREHPLAWAKFYRTTSDAPQVDTELIVREVHADERELFGSTVAAGNEMPPPFADWLARVVGLEGWHTYVSFQGAEPAGAAALFVCGDLAWLGMGATRPAMRKRGSQSALLARRIADAARFGAHHASTETGVPQEGHAAPSYMNIVKAGFEVAYVRPNWAEPM